MVGKGRIGYIDFLKTICLLCLFLAHVNCPKWLFMLRTFDVPLMVILSGILAGSSGNSDYIEYVEKRFLRLVCPTWIFLSIYFISLFFCGHAFNWSLMIKSFLFQQDGIQFVWIIWVYMLCACFVPLLKRIELNKGIWLCVIYLFYEVLYFMRIGIDNRFVYYTFYYFPYIFLIWYGMNLKYLTNRTKYCIVSLLFFVFIVLCILYYASTGYFVSLQTAKYPPRIYFLSYSVSISTFLITILSSKDLAVYYSKYVVFSSKHSLWLYLWHIPFILIGTKIIANKFGTMSWLFVYCIVVFGAYIVVYIQDHFVTYFGKKYGFKWLLVFKG